jgi:hypothetical protein
MIRLVSLRALGSTFLFVLPRQEAQRRHLVWPAQARHSHPIHLVNRSVPINFNNLIALLVRDFDNTTKVFVSCYRQYGQLCGQHQFCHR